MRMTNINGLLAALLVFLATCSGAQAGALNLLGAGPAQPLPPDQAFHVTVTATDVRHADAAFDVTPGYYLYRSRLHFRVGPPGHLAPLQAALPAGTIKSDPYFGAQEVYYRPFHARLTLPAPLSGPTVVEATFQGCSEQGLCYPPMTRSFTLVAPAVAGTISAGADVDASAGGAARLLAGGLAGALPAFFGFGLLLAFTPCMLPMLPVLSGIIVGDIVDRRRSAGRGRAAALATVYVLGMALTYAVAGVAAGLTGGLLQAALQTPWALGAFSLVFVALALSMFDVYTLQLPAGLQGRLSAAAGRLPGGRFAGVFAMGVVSALIVGPCVAAPLAGALLYISRTHDVLLGGAALFAMALGMGAPLVLAAAAGGSLLPRAGAWMQAVKRLFGLLLLAAAVWVSAPVLPPTAVLALAGLLLLFAAWLLLPWLKKPAPAGMRLARSGLALIVVALGAVELAGAAAGHVDLLAPLAANAAAQTAAGFVRVTSLKDLNVHLAAARGRPVLLDFYADWCVSCHELDRFTFSDPAVRARLAGMTLLQADVTRNTPDDAALLRHFGLFGPPGIILYDAAGHPDAAGPIIGYLPPDALLQRLNAAKLNGE